MSTTRPIPVSLITGFLGAGKTTAVLDLFERRPPGERWAVLVNEFGEIGIDGAVLAGGGMAVKEVAGGCICCAAQLPLRVALTRLLREAKPDRLLIEASGLAHAAGIIDLLRDEWLAGALTLRATLCLVDPRQFAAPEAATQTYREQLAAADVLIANKTDLAAPDQVEAFLSFARTMYPPRLEVAQTRLGRLDTAWLDLDPRADSISPAEVVGHPDIACATRGWRFPPEVAFDRERLHGLFQGLDRAVPGLVRAKGVFRLGKAWVSLNWSAGRADIAPTAYRRDSRVDLVAAGAAPDWGAFEVALLEARCHSGGVQC